jgi:hypothetical protein
MKTNNGSSMSRASQAMNFVTRSKFLAGTKATMHNDYWEYSQRE